MITMCLIFVKPRWGLGTEGGEGEELIEVPLEHPPRRVARKREITRIVRTTEHTSTGLNFQAR